MQRHHAKAFLFILAAFLLPAQAADITVASPDGQTLVTLSDADGQLAWSLSYNRQDALLKAPLGLTTNEGVLGQHIYIKERTRERVTEDYTLDRCKTSAVHYDANRLIVDVIPNEASRLPGLAVEFQVSNNNVAFRYCLSPAHDRRCLVIESEQTTFLLPKGTTSYLTPQSNPMIGWKRTKPSYEEEYEAGVPIGRASRYNHGYTFPCLFNTTPGYITARGAKQDMKLRFEDPIWILISETGVSSSYCGSRLSDIDPFGACTIAYPMPGENNGFGSTGAQIGLPGTTPWRTVTVGTSLAPIVETTIPFDVVKPLYEPSIDYQYGRSTWSWEIWDDASICEKDILAYIDLSASLGWEYCLIDNFWDERIGREKIEELSRYAQKRGVHLFLWYNSSGAWNDSTQSPYDVMSNIITRRKEMAWMKEIGIKGIKVDFWGGDKQETMRLYEEVLVDANEFGLMVIFHGCTLPRGWERMYPNYVGSEAVLASENLKFSQHSNDMEAFNACMHPFIRNTVGCMEFGGSALNKYYSRDNLHGNHRVCGDAFELACTVLFQNPIQNFALTPKNLTDAPNEAINFMKQVPTTWDETRYLAGEPGKYIMMARRHADKWYVAAINATGKEQNIMLNPAKFGFSGKTLKVYTDDKKMKFSYKDIKINKKGQFPLSIPTNGGAVVILPANN